MGGSSDISETLTDIWGHASDLNLSYLDLANISALKSLRAQRQSAIPWADKVVKLISIIPLLLSIFLFALALTLAGVLVNIAYFNGFHSTIRFVVEDVQDGVLLEEKCLVELYEVVKDYIRPPVYCSFCSNITEVDVVSKLTRQSFEEKYAYSGRPVIIVDAMDDWSAVDTFTFEYLKSLYASNSPALSDSSGNEDCQFFPYKTEFSNMSEVFSMSPERYDQPWYIGWSNCDSKVANALRQHYHKPYFLPEVSESSKLDWIFMGRPGFGAHMHIDAVDSPSWQAQIRGTKKWTLEPPPECYFECPATRIDVTVRPGDIIVLDTNVWFHMTEVVGPEISIVIGSEYD